MLRVYVLFMGDYEQAAPWSEQSMKGCKRFLDRIWALQEKLVDGDSYRPELTSLMHKTIKKVSEDIEAMKFNTAIAAMMSLLNEVYDFGSINKAETRSLLIMLNPFAPHITEEMYNKIFGGILNEQEWVKYDEKLCVDSEIEVAVQVNGKIKAKVMVPAEAEQDKALEIAKAAPDVAAAIDGKNIVKEIYVKGRLVNIVVK